MWIIAISAVVVALFLYRQTPATTLDDSVVPIATTTNATTTGTNTPPPTSGVMGTISLGPTCPVERDPPDPECADKPYATAVIVYRASTDEILIIGSSDAVGVFKLALSPGFYTVTAGGGAVLPRCERVKATVLPGEYTPITITCDSGIR